MRGHDDDWFGSEPGDMFAFNNWLTARVTIRDEAPGNASGQMHLDTASAQPIVSEALEGTAFFRAGAELAALEGRQRPSVVA